MKELIKISELKPETLFSKESSEMDDVLEKIRLHTESLVLDVKTSRGRADIISLATKVASSKAALEKMGKDHVAILKEKSSIVDGKRRHMRETLDKLKTLVRKPVTDYENKEKERVKNIELKIANLEELYIREKTYTLIELREIAAKVIAFKIDESFDEFKGSANRIKDRHGDLLYGRIKDAEKAEEDSKELARLKKEEQERIQKERDEEIRRKAAAKAEMDAKEEALIIANEKAKKVAADKKKLEDEKIEAERGRIAAEERAKIEIERAEEAEKKRIEGERIAKESEQKRILEKKEESARAEEKKLENEKLAKKNEEKRVLEKKEEEEKALKREEFAKIKAVNDEKARVRKIKEQDAQAEKDRKDDQDHRRLINRSAMEAIFETIDISEEDCQKVIIQIALGKIPNVSIKY